MVPTRHVPIEDPARRRRTGHGSTVTRSRSSSSNVWRKINPHHNGFGQHLAQSHPQKSTKGEVAMHRVGRSLVAVALAMLWLVPAVFAQGGASLSIVSPTAGQKVTDTNIAVQVKVANFTVDCLQAGMSDKA